MGFNRFAYFIFLILIFLGVSKSFAPTGKSSLFVRNTRQIADLFDEMPVTVILLDAYDSGLMIKSHFHKYKVVRIYKPSSIITARVSKRFYERHLDHIGLSLFRRSERGDEYFNPVPPGSLFVGQLAYGQWTLQKSGLRKWQFHRAYRRLSHEFYWGEYRPTRKFVNFYEIHLRSNRPYFGPEDEFGPKGSVTQQLLEIHSDFKRQFSFNLKEYFTKLFHTNPFPGSGDA